MIIPTRNILHETAPKTYLMNTEAAGTTVFRLRNTSGFGSSWAIQIGETGEEQTEVLLLSGNPPAIGTLGTSTASSTFEHPADTPVYAIKFNQVVFERSTTGTAGTATPMTSGTITYQADRDLTQFDDTTGSTSYAYRTYFRNSVLGANTTESDWITSAGFTFYSLASMRERIKDKLWDSNYIKEDSTIDSWINEWLFEMRNSAIAVNEDYALGTVDVGFDGTDGFGTVTTADFKQLRRVDITYNGNDYFLATKMNINDYLPDEQFSSVHPYITWRGDTIFRVRPDESGGTARITFYRIGTTMVNETDELELPMRGYTKSFVDYGLAQAFLKDGKKEEYRDKLTEAGMAKNQFVSELTPRIKTGPTMVDIVEPLNSWDGWP
jgi:hypothetical protein